METFMNENEMRMTGHKINSQSKERKQTKYCEIILTVELLLSIVVFINNNSILFNKKKQQNKSKLRRVKIKLLCKTFLLKKFNDGDGI